MMILLFLTCLLIDSWCLTMILRKILPLEKGLDILFGFFLALYLIGFAAAIPIVLYRITPLIFTVLLLVLTLIIFFLNRLSCKLPTLAKHKTEENLEIPEAENLRLNKVCYLLLSLFGILAAFLLFKARTGQFFLSPWKVISPFYLYSYLVIAFIVALLVFSKHRARTVLIVIILFSLLCHSYLAIVYQSGCGGDKWRHIGAEKWLEQGNIYSPSLFGEKEVDWQQIGPLKIPSVFVIGNKTSYASIWGLSLALHWGLDVDFFWIDLLLGLLLWSVFIPLFAWKLAGYLSKKKSFRLLMAYLPLLFFPLQFYGGITLPLSFSFLFLLFIIILWLEYLTRRGSVPPLMWGLIIFTLLTYFGYLLYFILALEIAIAAWLLKRIFRDGASEYKKGNRWAICCLLFVVCCLLFLLPFLDTGYGLSKFRENIDLSLVVKSLGTFFGNLVSGQAIFPREHFVEQDNLIYMTGHETQTEASLLTVIPWAYILVPIILFFAVFGLARIKKMALRAGGLLLAIFLLITLFNQFIGSFLMEGNHIFTKRLVLFTSFMLLPFFAWGLWNFIQSPWLAKRAKVIFVSCLLSLVATTTYASGPKMQMVTTDELQAAKYLWEEMSLYGSHPYKMGATHQFKEGELTPGDIKGKGYCILANTWPLLALEAESGRHIVGGGFPIYFEYAQPERVQLFERMNQSPSVRYLEKSLEMTGASSCWFMTEKRWLGSDSLTMGDKEEEEILEKLKKTLGEPKRIGEAFIWHYTRENESRL